MHARISVGWKINPTVQKVFGVAKDIFVGKHTHFEIEFESFEGVVKSDFKNDLYEIGKATTVFFSSKSNPSNDAHLFLG
mgnify:CR=1 FL=1